MVKKNEIGKAISYFRCDDSIEDLKKELDVIKGESKLRGEESKYQIPENLEYTLEKVQDNEKYLDDSTLVPENLNYKLSVTHGKNNKEAADRAADLLNHASSSKISLLHDHKGKKKFFGEIVYKEAKDAFVSRV